MQKKVIKSVEIIEENVRKHCEEIPDKDLRTIYTFFLRSFCLSKDNILDQICRIILQQDHKKKKKGTRRHGRVSLYISFEGIVRFPVVGMIFSCIFGALLLVKRFLWGFINVVQGQGCRIAFFHHWDGLLGGDNCGYDKFYRPFILMLLRNGWQCLVYNTTFSQGDADVDSLQIIDEQRPKLKLPTFVGLSTFILGLVCLFRAFIVLSRSSRGMFLQLLRISISESYFVSQIQGASVFFDACDNRSTPIRYGIMKNNGIRLVLIQNGARMDLASEGYIRSDHYLGWHEMYRDGYVGGQPGSVFYAIGSLNILDSYPFYFSKETKEVRGTVCKYDFLVIEQLVFPEDGYPADLKYHKIMVDNLVKFAKEFPCYRIGYLCRYKRGDVTEGSVALDEIIEFNDQLLKDSKVEILPRDRALTGDYLRTSKVCVALSSSTRLESFFLGQCSVTCNYSNYAFDRLSLLLDFPFIISDISYSYFQAALSKAHECSNRPGFIDGDLEVVKWLRTPQAITPEEYIDLLLSSCS